MEVELRPDLQKFIERQVKSGRYDSRADLMAAALTRLMEDERESDFAPGELQALTDEGEADIQKGDTLTIAQVRKHFRLGPKVPNKRRPRVAKSI